MELENLSIENQRKQYGATSQSRPLQKMPFYPVGPGVDQILNRLIQPYFRCVEGYYVFTEREHLPAEIWEKIWDYLDSVDKLRLGSLAHSFEPIRPYVQLDVCRETLLNRRFYYTRRKSYVDVFCEIIATIADIHNDTNLDAIKIQCNLLLQENKGAAQEIIERSESWIKSQRHYTKTEEYQKLKYLKEVFDGLDTCNVWCTECKDECFDTGKDYLRCCCSLYCLEICLVCSCAPCIICDMSRESDDGCVVQ